MRRNPLLEHRGHLDAVLFEHHHVTIAVNPQLFETHVSVLDSCLRQILGSAMIIPCVVGSFRSYYQDRDALKIGELSRGIGLFPADCQVWPISNLFAYRR